MKNTAATFGLHDEDQAKEIWKGKYASALARARSEYHVAGQVRRIVQNDWSSFVASFEGETDTSPSEELHEIKRRHTHKGLAYVSTLFSAVNSLPGLIPGKKYAMLCEMRLVLSEIGKNDWSFFESTNKEAMIGYYNMLGQKFHGLDGNRDFYAALAVKCVNEVLSDVWAPFSTRMLTCARASMMPELCDELREDCRKEVLALLSDIRANPSKIDELQQGWKTYVRLARMMYAWRHMFFGLAHDRSIDLHLKSYGFFARYFYK
jgi:hypothetical protein